MGSRLTKDDVLHIAALAHLDLSDTEVDRLTGELADILAFAGQVAEVETRGVPPTTRLPGGEPGLRADVVRRRASDDDALSNAPESDRSHRFFTVPRVIGS